MRKDKTKRIILNRIVTIFMSIVLFAAVILTIVALVYNPSYDDVEFNKTTSSYASNQAQITEPKTTSTTDTVTMTSAYTSYGNIGGKVVTISTAEELYKFSDACNNDTRYLSQSYKLLSNIDYSITTKFKPVGNNGTAFTGTFDGNDYEIKGLELESITSQQENESKYPNMYYYAMFSVNAGTIKNLGLVDPDNQIINIEIEKIVNDGGVANLVGHNEANGTVEYCYLRDLRKMIDDEIGLAVYGNYRIAGLVYLNDGDFNNCYVAASTIANHDVQGYESISSLCYKDNNYNASTSKLYFYDGSIETYRLVSGVREVTYVDGVFDDNTFLTDDLNVGVYCASLSELNANFTTNNKWYYPAKYGDDLKIYVKNETPILRGLSYTESSGVYTFTVANTKDFLYMFELMNGSDFFAGNKVVFKITADINLINILPSAYTYNKIIASTITSDGVGGTVQPKLATNTTSTAPTIYNFDCVAAERKTLTLGIDAYGLFPYLSGTISNLNIIPNAVSLDSIDASTNVKGIAAVSGYVEKGHISNVNVYIITTHTSADIKEFYLGGVAGILGGEGTIDNCTVGGSFTMNRFVSTAPGESAYTNGNAIGGVVGYICETYGNIDTCLSAVNMTLNFNSSACNYQIGGVVGAAYTMTAQNLENIGTINIGTSSSEVVYNSLYVSGVVGRHYGVTKQVLNFTNQGNITLYAGSNSSDTYLSGVLNVDIVTFGRSTGIIASTDKTKDGKYRYRASSLTNRADIITGSDTVVDNIQYTSGVNILAKNGFVSELSGVYNLNYSEKYNVSGTMTKTTLGEQNFDMQLVRKYSGAVNVINGTSTTTTDLSTVYNLRDFAISASAAIGGANSFEYYGTVRGKYINYDDVRNEGKMTATLTKNIGTTGTDTASIRLIGVLEEISEGCSADKIFNGSDISLTYSNCNIYGSVIASGICYKNAGYNATTIDQYNPSSDDFDSKAKGALNNAINNGLITVDNPTNFANVSINYTTILSANEHTYLGSMPSTTYNVGYNIVGDIYATGIATYNEAPITNTFNLGDIFAANYISSTTTKEINVAGIAGLNIGKYAYILNSANNGNLKGINLSSNDAYKSNVNVSGIIARNDKKEDGSDYTADSNNAHSSQIVSFTINYGDIFAYNFRQNIRTTAYEPSSKASGIAAMGLLNTINVLNYGNIYGSETASGIFGILYFSKYASEVKSADTKVNIANTINYGNVYMLSRGYNNVHETELDYAAISYTRFKALTTSNIVINNATKQNNEAFTNVVRNTDYISVIGSVFAVANYAASENSKYINIRYLISFNSECSIVGATVNAPTDITVSTDTLYSAHISNNAATGAYMNDTWINKYVEYAPLSTASVSGKFVTAINTNTGVVTTANKTYYGIFNSNFDFSKAILGKTALDTVTNPTDAYLTDYFQFVGFKYINPILFEKIGWQTLAYKAAADDFATDVENVIKVIEKTSGYNFNTLKSEAKNAFNWMQHSVSDDLDVLIDSLVEEENYTDLLSVLQYIFSDDSSSSIYITTEVRRSVLNKLITQESELVSLLNSVLKYNNGYSSTLAKSIIDKQDEVKDYIDEYVDALDASDLTSLLNSYITYLEANSNAYFNYSVSESQRIELLKTLFANVNDANFYTQLVAVLDLDSTTVSETAKMYAGYRSLSTAQKKTLFETIVSYNYGQSKIPTYITNMGNEIDYYKELIANGLNVTSMEDLYSKADLNSGSTNTSVDVINERVNLWNLIRNTSVFQSNFSTFGIGTTYYKATEFNNTYQSVTEPHNNGAYGGETSENRLSYMYTLDITPQVYFYGPYTNTSGGFTFSGKTSQENSIRLENPVTNYAGLNVDKYDYNNNHNYQNTYFSVFHYDDNALWNSNNYMLSRGGANSTTRFSTALKSTTYGYGYSANNPSSYPYPVLIYYDYNNEQLGGANATYSTGTGWYSGDFGNNYSFRGFNSNQQFKYDKNFTDPMIGGSTKYTSNDWTGTLFGTNDLYMKVSSTGEIFSLNHAVLAKAYKSGGGQRVTLANGTSILTNNYRCYIQDSDGVYHLVQTGSNSSYDANATIQIGVMNANDEFEPHHTMKNYSSDNNTRYIYSLISYIAGLKMYTSTVSTSYHSTARTGIYRRSGGWNNYFTWKQTDNTRVYTSQYIDYANTDLYNLDGYLTQYSDGTTYSEDERDIINALFNTYFLKSTKYTTFRNLIQAALLEALGDNSTRGTTYIDNFLMTNIYSATNISGSIPFAYLYRQNNQTVQTYLKNQFTLGNDNKNVVIYDCASNQFKYVGLVKMMSAISAIPANNSYADYSRLLTDLVTNDSYVVNDKVVMSNYSSLTASQLDALVSCFNDTSQNINISNLYSLSPEISAYTGSIIYNTDSYNSESYSYGLKFNSMTLTPASTDTRVIMVTKSTGSSSTLTAGTDSVEVTGLGEYYFETNGATSFTITSNNDVVVYKIYYINDAINNDVVNGSSVTITSQANTNAQYFTAITQADALSAINSDIVSKIGSGTYYKIDDYSVVYSIAVNNTNANSQTLYFATSSDKSILDSSELATGYNYPGSTITTRNLTINDYFYGQPIFAVWNTGTKYQYQTARFISSASYVINYSYVCEKEYGSSSRSVNSTTDTTSANPKTIISQAQARNYVLSELGLSTWDTNTMTITSVAAHVTMYLNYTDYHEVAYDSTTDSLIKDLGTVSGYSNYSFVIDDVSSIFEHQLDIRYVYNGNYTSDTDASITSIYYTINYTYMDFTDVARTTAIPNTDMYKTRLLNLDLSYSGIESKYLANIFNRTTNYATKNKDFITAALTSFVSVNTSGNDNNPTNPFVSQLNDNQKMGFARKVIENSNEALYYAIAALCDTKEKLGQVLSIMDKTNNGYAYVADAVVKLATGSTDLIETKANVLKTLEATYVVANYRSIINQDGNVYSSKYQSLVANVNTNATGSYKNNIGYINSDGSFDPDKYNLFVEYILGQDIATQGYGIFALASSRGIKNGAFIPDNVSLGSMDVNYNTTTKLNNVSYIELTTSANSAWRDKVGGTTGEANISNTSSVNYHVIKEMKQLLKAISNVIFELDLECDDTILYSSTDQIDYENKVITYYVSESYLNYIKSASSLEIERLVFADTATSNKNNDSSIALTKSYVYSDIALTSSTFVANTYYTESAGVYTLAATYSADAKYYELTEIVVADAVTIIPEETAYTAHYKIRFVKIDNTITTFSYYSMYYYDEDTSSYKTDTLGMNIPYLGAKITFNVVSNNLPNGMDLKSFFNITNELKDDVWSFDLDAPNNGIVSNNTAKIVVNVDISMKQGLKEFVLNIYSSSKAVDIEKDPNRKSEIISFGYDGTDLTTDISDQSASSDILFGRAFNYDDLTVPYILTTDQTLAEGKTYYIQNGYSNSYSYTKVLNPDSSALATYYEPNPDFYLYKFEISANATVEITATKSENATTGLMTYVVKYKVKSEYGTSTEYTHTLTENLYFENGSTFATLYKDGVAMLASDIYKTNFYYGEEVINAHDLSSLTYSSTAADNFVAVIFNRGYEPQYRIRYNLSRFYGDSTKYTITQGTLNPSTSSPNDTYAGITITIDDEQEPGTYLFNYVYTNTGTWTSEGGWVTPTEFDPNATYYFDLGDGEYLPFADIMGEDITAENFDIYKEYAVVYVSAGDPTYTRTYTFPALYIVKDFAIDALFHKLSFLDESKVLGGTASVMLPTTPISAGDGDLDSDAVSYKSVFGNYDTQKIVIKPNSIVYDDTATVPAVTDYYTVGTVSDTDLENYAPTIKVEDHAQVFKYTTITKLTTYGSENNQTAKDSDILKVKNNMLLYVPFVSTDNESEVFMVLLDNNLKWTKIYKKDFDGKNLSASIHTYGTPFTTLAAEEDPTLTTFTTGGKTYSISEVAGSTDVTSENNKNLSLYMDYIGTPLDDHFWYVSYVVFSEYYLNKGKTDANTDGVDDLGAVRYYHISIVDASNTVYFDVSLYAPENFKLDDIYLTFAEDVYNDKGVKLRDTQLSCYVEKQKNGNDLIYGTANTDVAGLVLYKLKLSMAAMPAGYFYFYVDLPNGYGAICYTTRANEINNNTTPGSNYPGSYLPHASIIPITIGLKIIVSELTGESSSVWAVNTSDLYTRKITYSGTYVAEA